MELEFENVNFDDLCDGYDYPPQTVVPTAAPISNGIVDEVQKQTDMGYDHVVNGEEYDDDESQESAKYLLLKIQVEWSLFSIHHNLCKIAYFLGVGKRKITRKRKRKSKQVPGVFPLLEEAGGIGDLLGQAQNNVDNPIPLGACLDALRLILECIHPNDLELLDKCCYILSNLSFNNAQNMTAIIELGGVNDIVGVLKKNKEVNFLCESAINVLVNLCHNSDKNQTIKT